MNELKKKHPDSQPQFQHLLLRRPVQEVNPVIFDKLDETTILQAASRTKGAGPSMSNADDWRRILVSHHYGNTTVDLRKSIVTMAKKLCTEKNEDSDSIESLVGCRPVSYTHLTLPTILLV